MAHESLSETDGLISTTGALVLVPVAGILYCIPQLFYDVAMGLLE